jgi:hypothetical protein
MENNQNVETGKISKDIMIIKSKYDNKELQYKDVADLSYNSLKLKLAEFGDGSDYSTAEGYAYWNKSGNRRDPAGIYIEYDFDGEDADGRKVIAGTVHFLDINYDVLN